MSASIVHSEEDCLVFSPHAPGIRLRIVAYLLLFSALLKGGEDVGKSFGNRVLGLHRRLLEYEQDPNWGARRRGRRWFIRRSDEGRQRRDHRCGGGRGGRGTDRKLHRST